MSEPIEIIDKNLLSETKFEKHKTMTNEIVLKLDTCGFKKESELVRNCASYLLFSSQKNVTTSVTRLKLKKANFCKFRFCNMCSWRRSINTARKLLEALEFVEHQTKISYLFLTLTVQNPLIKDLKESTEHLNKSFQRMSQTKAYKNAVLGSFKALEILGDNTKDGEAHPHLHILLIVKNNYFTSKNYIKHDTWVEMWKDALRVDYSPFIDVRKVRTIELNKDKNLTALQSAVFEVAKYTLKHTELTRKNCNDFTHIINQTKNMRFYSAGGFLKDMLDFIKNDEEILNLKKEENIMWEEIEELLYKWKDGNYFLNN